MDNTLHSLKYSPPLNNTEIYAFRTLAKILLKNDPIFFNVESGVIKPVDVCIKNNFLPAVFESWAARILLSKSEELNILIKNNKPTNILLKENQKIANLICSLKPEGNDPVKCIKLIDFILSPNREEVIICNSKVKVKIEFKMVFLITFLSGKPGIILLPDDEGVKFCFNKISFPVEYTDLRLQKILDIDRVNKWFTLTMIILLKNFEGIISSDIFRDHTLQSKFTIGEKMPCLNILLDNCSCNQNAGTHVAIKIKADMVERIGIEQCIII